MEPDLEWGLEFAWYSGEAWSGAGIKYYDSAAGPEFFPDIVCERCYGYMRESIGINIFVLDEKPVIGVLG